MFEVKFDYSELEKKAQQLGGTLDQIPFAISLAMNAAVRNAKIKLVEETWPRHVKQRNSAFIDRALQIDFSTKRELRVEIYDDLGRANLSLHLFGGMASPRSGRFAVPSSTSVARTAQGVRSNQRPRNITNSFVADLRGYGAAIWKRVGTKGRNLKLMYMLKPSTRVPADVPFENDFREAMTNELRASLPATMAKAMAGRWR